MAKKYSFIYRGYGLGGVNGKAVAIQIGEDGERLGRFQLYAPRQPEEAARNALIAFVDGLEQSKLNGDPTIDTVLGWYVEKLESEGKFPNGVLRPGNMLSLAFGSLLVSQITDTVCKKTAEAWEAEYKPWTIWKALNQLRAAIKWSEPNRKVPIGSHLRVWNVKTPEGRDRVLTPDEFRRLLDSAKSEHVRLYMLLLLFTAQRPDACAKLRWDQVDLTEGVIDFRLGKQAVSITNKKGTKGRGIVTIPAPLRGPLEVAKAKAETKYVIEFRGNPVGRVTTGFNVARDAAGLGKDVTAHVIRHTAATMASGDGTVDETATSRFLGHAQTSTTRKTYIHPKAEAAKPAQQAVVDKMVQALRITRIK